jgi:hypothetical protein
VSQSLAETTPADRETEAHPQNGPELAERHADVLAEIGRQGLGARAQMDASGADSVGGLQRVTSLYAPTALLAATHLDEEQSDARPELRDVLFVSYCLTRRFDIAAAAVGAARADRCLVLLVDVVGNRPARLHAVVPARLAPRTLGVGLRGTLREGGGLSLASAVKPPRDPRAAERSPPSAPPPASAAVPSPAVAIRSPAGAGRTVDRQDRATGPARPPASVGRAGPSCTLPQLGCCVPDDATPCGGHRAIESR